MKPKIAVALSAMLMSSACASSIQSTLIRDRDEVGEGVSYHLPKRMVRLVVDRKALNPDRSKEFLKLHQAQIALNDAVAAENMAMAALDAAMLALSDAGKAEPPLPESAIKTLDDDVKAKKLSHDMAKNTSNERKKDVAAAEAAYLEAVRKRAEKSKEETVNYEETVTLSLTPLIPDEEARFTAKMNHNWFRSDDWDLRVSAAGLLSKGDSKPDGELDEVIIELGKVALAIINPGGVVGGSIIPHALGNYAGASDPNGSDIRCPADRTFHYELEFDPSTKTAAEINEDLRAVCSYHRIAFNFEGMRPSTENQDKFDRGLVYRRERPFSLTVTRFHYDVSLLTKLTGDANFEPYRSATLMIPNGAPVEVLPYGASYVSQQSLSATFENGMLTGADFTKPGEAQTIAGIPAAVLTGATGLVKEVLTVRTENLTKTSDGIAAQVSATENLQKLLEAQIAYEKAYSDYLEEKSAAPVE